jgi:hypothetical protein
MVKNSLAVADGLTGFFQKLSVTRQRISVVIVIGRSLGLPISRATTKSVSIQYFFLDCPLKNVQVALV